MAVPSNVAERINKLGNSLKRIEDRKRGDPADLARRQAIEADRRARRPLLLEFAVEIFGWRDSFVKSREGQQLWSLIGSGARVPIFADWFWDGAPIREDNPLGAHTRVSLDGTGHHFLLEEWRRDDVGGYEPYLETARLKSPLEMVDRVHPLLIEALQTHLSGPEAWQMLIDELDRRLDRYVQP